MTPLAPEETLREHFETELCCQSQFESKVCRQSTSKSLLKQRLQTPDQRIVRAGSDWMEDWLLVYAHNVTSQIDELIAVWLPCFTPVKLHVVHLACHRHPFVPQCQTCSIHVQTPLCSLTQTNWRHYEK